MRLGCQPVQRASHAQLPHLRPTACGRHASHITAALGPGSAVRVTAPITVYHSPKFRAGLQIQGLHGTIQSNVALFKGKVLSANKPWKVALEAQDPAGKAMKLIVHLVRSGMGPEGRSGGVGERSPLTAHACMPPGTGRAPPARQHFKFHAAIGRTTERWKRHDPPMNGEQNSSLKNLANASPRAERGWLPAFSAGARLPSIGHGMLRDRAFRVPELGLEKPHATFPRRRVCAGASPPHVHPA